MSELDEEKLFYERFYALHRDPILLRICEQFSIEVFRRSCVLEGLESFLKANNFSGDCCVEIGTRNGLTAVVLARYFREVVTIDIEPNQMKYDVARCAGVCNVRFVDVVDNDAKTKLIAGLKFDAAFSDGDHARDTKLDFTLLERCGRVLFHENWESQPEVWRLVHRLRSKGTVVTEGKLALWTA